MKTLNADKIYAEALVNEYTPKSTSKTVALKKLDAKVKRPVLITAFTVGIIGSLVMGTGMCFAMGVLGSGIATMVFGIIIGLLGIVMISVNYPLYKRNLAKAKEKYAFEIIELAREIVDGK